MHKLLLVGVLSASLFSCSLLQRHSGPDSEGDAASAAAKGENDGPLFTSDGEEVSSAKTAAAPNGDADVSRLNTKVAALETKVDVLSSTIERLQAEHSQPIIQAEPQASLAAPVSERNTEVEDQTPAADVSAAPVRPARHITPVISEPLAEEAPAAPSKSSTAAEREFGAGMQLFQNGQNLEAASRFALMSKKFPHHLLASHALYWAGEAASRARQWSIAAENWAELERKYPHSAYVPEALAGLAKAYEAQGDATKAKVYRALLARGFPKSPVALKASVESVASETVPAKGRPLSHSPAAPLAASDEEAVPVFEENKTSSQNIPGQVPDSDSGAQ